MKNRLWVVGIVSLAVSLAALAARAAASEEVVPLGKVPAKVRATIEKHAEGAKIQKVEVVTEKGKRVYDVEIQKDGKTIEFSVSPDGKYLGVKSDDGEDEAGAKPEKKEVKGGKKTVKKGKAAAKGEEEDEDNAKGGARPEKKEVKGGKKAVKKGKAEAKEEEEDEDDAKGGARPEKKEVKGGRKAVKKGKAEAKEEEEDKDDDKSDARAVKGDQAFKGVPKKVRAAAKKLVGKGKIVRLVPDDKEGNYELEYVVSVAKAAIIGPDGQVREMEETIDVSALPKAVMAAVKKLYPGGKIELAEISRAGDRTVYELKVVVGKTPHGVVISADGKVQETSAMEKEEAPEQVGKKKREANKDKDEEDEAKDGKRETRGASAKKGGTTAGFAVAFDVRKANLVSIGRNPYFFPLEPGYRLVLQGGNATLTVTVTGKTKLVDGVQTRVVEEREEKDGQPLEISQNYFAIDRTTGAVYYFGEDVDIYKDGKVVSHEGAWLSGVKGAKFGMMMPGKPKVGSKFQQEIAPAVAMDRCEIVGIGEEVRTPAGRFKDCVRTREGSSLEPGTGEKVYAPGVGLIKDDEFVLTKITRVVPKKTASPQK